MRPFCAQTADGAGALRRAGDEPGRYRLRDRELALHHWWNAPRVSRGVLVGHSALRLQAL